VSAWLEPPNAKSAGKSAGGTGGTEPPPNWPGRKKAAFRLPFLPRHRRARHRDDELLLETAERGGDLAAVRRLGDEPIAGPPEDFDRLIKVELEMWGAGHPQREHQRAVMSTSVKVFGMPAACTDDTNDPT
jgi:hypothetical protein